MPNNSAIERQRQAELQARSSRVGRSGSRLVTAPAGRGAGAAAITGAGAGGAGGLAPVARHLHQNTLSDGSLPYAQAVDVIIVDDNPEDMVGSQIVLDRYACARAFLRSCVLPFVRACAFASSERHCSRLTHLALRTISVLRGTIERNDRPLQIPMLWHSIALRGRQHTAQTVLVAGCRCVQEEEEGREGTSDR